MAYKIQYKYDLFMILDCIPGDILNIFVGAGFILIDSTRPYSMGQCLHFQGLR